MRITLMGTAVPPRNLAQRMVSVFVEVGWKGAQPQLPGGVLGSTGAAKS